MGQSLGDLHYTLGINDQDLDKQLAAAKAKITAALGGIGGTAGSAASIKITGEATAANVRYASELQKTATANLTIAKTEAIKSAAMSKSALAAQQLLNSQAQHASILQRQSLASERAANAQKRLADQSAFTNKTFLSQGIIASQLATILGTTFSVYAIGAFVKKLAEVRGEFELQQVALRAITRDTEAADKIFSQVKTLSVKSPFTFMELLRDTKQLAAFSVETDKLFGTLTRLADVSAGLGVDMNRIILAYGQVRAATVLRGQELRQFTEAGIPIIDMLANKFSKLENTVVSAGDVFKRISEKMVSFKDVDEIFTQLTSSGGMFFEMQKKQSETLAGKLANLKDAYMIMLNSMGQGSEGTLKGGADLLYKLMNNWEKVADVIKVVVAAYGAYKLAVIGIRLIREAETAAIIIQAAATENLTRAQARNIAVTNLMSGAQSKLASIFSGGNIYATAIAALVALGSAMYVVYQNSNELQNSLSKVYSEEKGTADAQIVHLQILTEKLKGANEGSLQRKQLIEQINNVASPYLKNLIQEGESYGDIIEKLKGVNSAIYENAKAKAFQASETKITDKLSTGIAEAEALVGKGLTQSFGLNREQSSELITKMFSDIRNNPELIKQAGGLSAYMRDVMAKAGKSITITTDIGDLLVGLNKYKQAIDESKEATDKFSDSVSAWGNAGAPIPIRIKEIRDATAANVQQIRDSTNGMFKENEVRAKKIEGLLAEAAAYRALNMENEALKADRLRVALDPLSDDLSRLKKEVEGLREFKDSGVILGTLFPEQKDIESVTKSIIEGVKDTEEHYKSLAAAKKGIYTTEEIANANKIAIAYRAIAEQLLGWREKEKTGSEKKPKYLTDIEHEIELMKEAKKAYEDYVKVMSVNEAKTTVRGQFPGITFPTGSSDFEQKETISRLTTLYDIVQKHSDKYSKETAIKIKKDINETLKGGTIDAYEKFAKDIQEYFEKNKDKFDLYKTILDITGKKDLAMEVSFGVEFKDKNIRDVLRQQITDIMQFAGRDIKLPDELTGVLFKDIFSLEKTKNLTPEIIKQLENIFDTIKAYEQSENVERIKNIVELQKEFGSSEFQKTEIHRKFAKERLAIEKDTTIKNIEESQKMLKNLDDVENLEIAKVDSAAFKMTKTYRDLFADIEFYSIKRTREIIKAGEDILKQTEGKKAIKGEFLITLPDGDRKAVPETEIKDVIKRVEELKKKLREKDPFLQISDGLKLIKKGGEDARSGFMLISDGIVKIIDMTAPLSEALSQLGEATDNVKLKELSKDAQIAAEWLKTMANLAAGIASGNPAQIAASLIDITTKLIKAEAEYQESKKKMLLDNIKLQYEYNNLLTAERLLFLSGTTIFGTDAYGKAINSMGVYRDVVADATTKLSELWNMQVIIGTKRKTGWFLGLLGSLVTVGTENVYGSLLKSYPDLITKEGKLNVERAKSLLATDKLTDATKQLLEQLVELDDQAKEAYEQMTSYLTDVFGSLGQSLSDSIVKAFRDGEDASLDFKASVTSTIEKLTQDLMTSLFLSDYFSKFSKKVQEVYAKPDLSANEIGEQTIALMSQFYEGLGGIMGQSEEFLARMQESATKYGFNIFQPTAATEKSTLQGDIKALTEDTGQLLASLANAIRGDVSNQLVHIKSIEGILTVTGESASQSLAQLVLIQSNTFQMAQLLKSVIGGKGSQGDGIRVWA